MPTVRWDPKGHEEKYRAAIDGETQDEPVGLCQEARRCACCAEDEGRSFEAVCKTASNSRGLLQSKAVVVNVMVKRRDTRSRHVRVGETNVGEPPGETGGTRFQWKTVVFRGWHEPDKPRGLRPVL